jgi:nitrite reductase/ring-hydroxylating ferredoxin subunit/uncharacterized membrane protein
MRSKASFKGHPIHPSLIPFPFAFLTGAFVFDAIGRVADRPSVWTTGAHLAWAGIVTALLAAVPGFIDYRSTVPPRSSGKRRATRHMIVNLSAVGLFVIALWLRGDPSVEPPLATLALEAVALGLLAAGGWMGGVLVHRNQIGVDHRYAKAGRWKEVTVERRDGEPLVVAKHRELEVDQMKLLQVDGRRIVLGRTADGYVAFDDRCTHKGGSLAGGVMICGTVQCPWHGSQFDARSGAVKAGPAEEPLASYRVEERDGEIRLAL